MMVYHVISPHIDDAFLSIGGLLIELSKQKEKVVIDYVFTLTDFTNPDSIATEHYKGGVQAVSELRKNEERLVNNRIGYAYTFLDYPDGPLRSGYTPEQENALAGDIKARLEALSNLEDLFFFPLGVSHPDHLIIREIGLYLLGKGCKILFYEDMPYLNCGLYDLSRFYACMGEAGFRPVSVCIDFEEKLAVLQLYDSQVSYEWLKDIMNYSYCTRDGQYYERYWEPGQEAVARRERLFDTAQWTRTVGEAG